MTESRDDFLSANTEARSTETFAADINEMIRARTTELGIDEQEAVAALPSGAALLVVRQGPGAGARFLLDDDSAIAGRHPSADIFLDDVTVSRKHAEFVRRGVQFSVKDLGSLNGTYLNGEIIDGEKVLISGSVVQVGKYKLTFFCSQFDLPEAH